ncbi:MAG TPA: LysM peptidoglycan-binding domain-containing protein, partial [Chloroflexi bacterium]|nr:LysM peptidoglycan-binding domain-containing protein [Chloroflexota bacterium]
MKNRAIGLTGLMTACVTLVTLATLVLAACQTQIVESPGEPAPSIARATTTPTRKFPNTHTPPASPTTPVSATGHTPPADQGFAQYVVQAGDTLLGIAMAHDLPMAAIQIQNNLGASTIVKVGQTLSIPPRAAWEGASHFWVVHVVEEGETIGEIAKTYGLKADALQTANGLPDANMIVVGQELVLPLKTFAVAQAPPPAPTPAPPPTPTPEPASASAYTPSTALSQTASITQTAST